MGISNQIPNSRISQAGVCTSSTRPASPYEGQMIYETDTDKALTWDGSAWNPTTGVLPNIVEATTTNSVGTSSTTYISTGLSVTINKTHTNSAIWVLASPHFSMWTGNPGSQDAYVKARIIETGSSRERDYLNVMRTYNVNSDPRVESIKACLQWVDTATGTGSRTYRIDFAVDNSSRTAEFNMFTNGVALSEITAWEIMQ